MDVKSIISQMTLEEKAALCSGKDFWHLDTPQRLGIESVMVSDGPCGIRKQSDAADHLGLNASVPATSYPTGSCMACSFDRELFRRSGEVLGHACQAEDLSVLLGPAINIKRSPLGGRNFEYLSEDPYLTGELAKNYINGVQSQNVGVSVKHFAANSQEYNRMSSDSVVDERTLREIYLSAFETAVKDSKPWTIMCSYNRINGTFAAENKRLLTDILRDEWGFDGYVMSDWGATTADRVKCLEAGMELEMPGKNAANDKQIVDAVNNGTLDIKVLDTAVERILNIVLKYTENKQPETKIRDLYFFIKNGRLFFQFEGPFHDRIVFVDFLFKKFQAVSDKGGTLSVCEVSSSQCTDQRQNADNDSFGHSVTSVQP